MTELLQSFSEGSLENVLDGSYPLGRFLFLYINRAPGKPLHPLVREFGKFVFSKEGQEIFIKDGYMPVPYEVIVEELAKLDKRGEAVAQVVLRQDEEGNVAAVAATASGRSLVVLRHMTLEQDFSAASAE